MRTPLLTGGTSTSLLAESARSVPTLGEQLRARLRNGEVLTLGWCQLHGAAIWTAGTLGTHAAVLDVQHGDASPADWVGFAHAMAARGVAALFRAASTDPAHVGQLLVIFPQVTDATHTHQALTATRYAPHGTRSHGGLHSAPGEPLRIIQIETAEAVDHLDAILATPGLDAVYIGPWDLGLDLGTDEPGNLHGPQINGALTRIAAACETARVPWGVHTTTTSAAQLARGRGATLVNVFSDTAALTETASQAHNLATSLAQTRTQSTGS